MGPLDWAMTQNNFGNALASKQTTFTGTREERANVSPSPRANGAIGVIFGTSGHHVERELGAYAQVAGLR